MFRFLSATLLIFLLVSFQNCGQSEMAAFNQAERADSSPIKTPDIADAKSSPTVFEDSLPPAMASAVKKNIFALGASGSDLSFLQVTTTCTYNVLNWQAGYKLTALIRYFELTGDLAVLDIFARRAAAILAARNATVNGLPYGWREPHSGYVWAGFTGHIYSSMLIFARLLLDNPMLAARKPTGMSLTLGQLANEATASFVRAWNAHAREYEVIAEGQASYKFPMDMPGAVPYCNSTGSGMISALDLRGTRLPVNMNSLMFTATLYYGLYLEKINRAAAQPYFNQVAAFARFLNASVFKLLYFQDRMVIHWNYSERLGDAKIEDLPHSNVTVNFAEETYRRGLGFDAVTLRNLGNTFYTLLPASGPITADSIRPDVKTGMAHSIYYWPLMIRHNGQLRSRFETWLNSGTYTPHDEALISYVLAMNRM